MDPIDKLLAELKVEQTTPLQPVTELPLERSETQSVQSLDELLGQIAEETKQAVRTRLSGYAPIRQHQELPSPPLANEQPSDHLSQLLTQLNQESHAKPAFLPTETDQSAEEQWLAQLGRHYGERDHAARAKQQQEQRAIELQQQCQKQKRQRQEQERQLRWQQLQAQRRATLAEQAQEWLKRLNTKSSEGLWFEEFACSYASRLEAAIDYLEALQQVNQGSP
jgi:hypothetical protein